MLNHTVVQNLHIHKYVDSRHTYRLSETFTTTSAYTGKGIHCTNINKYTSTHTHSNTQSTNKQMNITHTKTRDGEVTPYTLLRLVKLLTLIAMVALVALVALLSLLTLQCMYC